VTSLTSYLHLLRRAMLVDQITEWDINEKVSVPALEIWRPYAAL